MENCPHYRENVKLLDSREITHQPTIRRKVVIPFCTHEHSPAVEHFVTKVVGGAHVLKCGGDVNRCQVSHSGDGTSGLASREANSEIDVSTVR